MPRSNIAVPSPPSAVRVAIIWLTLSIASVAGFASAQPTPVEPSSPGSATSIEIGSSAGLIAAGIMGRQPTEVPPRTARWTELVATHFHPRDVPLALRVIHCESSGSPDAVNADSGAAGLFQHLPRFWDERSTEAGAASSIHDPAANVAVAAWLVYEGGGWRHWEASRQCWGDRSALR